MKIYKLNKVILQLKNNAVEFLNGLTSNTIDTPQSAFVDIHGKIIAVFDQYKVDDEEVWILVEAPFVDSVLAHLDRYMKLSGVKAQKLDWHIYFDLDGDYQLKDKEIAIPQIKGKIILTPQSLPVNVKESEFTAFRVQNHIPQHGVDFKDDFLLNVSEKDDLVSFTKGCFLGQEPISKVHNRSKPTWKLVVKDENDCSDEEKAKMTSKTVDPKTQKTKGFVFVKNV
jgi:folate-binding protein YgfZ